MLLVFYFRYLLKDKTGIIPMIAVILNDYIYFQVESSQFCAKGYFLDEEIEVLVSLSKIWLVSM